MAVELNAQSNHYGFRLPDELVLLRDQIRRFMREEVKPIEDKLPHDATGCSSEDRKKLRALAEEMGLTRLTVPEEYGGNPVSALARVVIAEESAKCRLGGIQPRTRSLWRWATKHYMGRNAGSNRTLRHPVYRREKTCFCSHHRTDRWL